MTEEEENNTATIGFRVPPSFKQWAKEVAEERLAKYPDNTFNLLEVSR